MGRDLGTTEKLHGLDTSLGVLNNIPVVSGIFLLFCILSKINLFNQYSIINRKTRLRSIEASLD